MDSRRPELFLLICQQNNRYEIKVLAEKFQVSTRTIYNDIKKLNELLLAEGYEEIKIEKSIIFYEKMIPLSFERLINLDEDYILTHPKIRRLRLLGEVLMFQEQFSMDDLKEKLPLSRNTLLSDLKWVKEELSFHQIEFLSRPFIGYQVLGDEKDIRHLLVLTLQEDPLVFEGNKKQQKELEQAEKLLNYCAEMLEITFSDSSFDTLLLTFWVTYSRIKLGKKLSFYPKNTKEEKLLLKSRKLFEEEFGISFHSEELMYLAQKLTESSLINYNDDINEKWLDYHLMAADLIKKVSELSGNTYFLEDDLLHQGIINHLRPAFNRVISHSEINNPMFDYITRTFKTLHNQVCQGMVLIEEQMKITFTEQEISFFTLFFIASVERRKSYPTKPKKIIIVCDAGVSTSQILRSKLEVNFDVIIQGTFGKRTAGDWLRANKTDLIISTIPFNYPNVESIQVAPFVTEEDMKKLYLLFNTKKEKIDMNEIVSIINQEVVLTSEQKQTIKAELMTYFRLKNDQDSEKGVYQPMLVEVLNEKLIKVNYEASNRDEAVKASGQLLVDSGLAKQSYVDGMLENVEVNGTYIVIAPGIAMPHARPETGALDIGLSIVTLKEPVVFGHPQNDPVNIVVGLCAVDHQSHLKALSELVEILGNEEKITQIKTAETAEDIMTIIRGGN